MRIGLNGLGAVGLRAARHLLSDPEVQQLVVLDRDRRRAVRRSEGFASRTLTVSETTDPAWTAVDAVVVAAPGGAAALAAEAVAEGAHVVAAVDDPTQVGRLLALDGVARDAGVSVVVGATMAPGLSCLLVGLAASRLDRVDEVHVSSFGTGGPACARRHHAALSGVCTDWYDGAWRHRPGGSGRQLVWFPDPVGPADCYRARLVDPVLLVPAYPGVRRVTARMAATRRDRLTAPLPMLRPPHPEGALGSTRAEVRGLLAGACHSVVFGSEARPGLAAGTVAAVAALWAVSGRLSRAGAAGLAELVAAPGPFLAELRRRGITVSEFEGSMPANGGYLGERGAGWRGEHL